jgi:hypothetical protein
VTCLTTLSLTIRLCAINPAATDTDRVTLAEHLIEEYRSAFLRADLDGLVNCFGFPLQVTSVTEDEVTISVAGSQDWPVVLNGLLGFYRHLQVAEAVMLEVDSFALMDGVTAVRVHWDLQRIDGSSIYNFTAVYTVGRLDGTVKIIAIAHDELVRSRAVGLNLRTS